MKTDKDGKIKLTGIDYRVNNFVWSNFTEAVAFSDINRTVQTKVSKRTVVGMMLDKAIKEKNDRFLLNYGAFLFYLNGATPDQQFLNEAFKAAKECIERHSELYGPQNATEEEEKEIAEDMKGMAKFSQELKEAVEKEKKQKKSKAGTK